MEPGSKISMYAETRAEWMISCLGAFSQNIHVCTVYTNLGDEAVIHALNETEVNMDDDDDDEGDVDVEWFKGGAYFNDGGSGGG